MSFRVSSLNVLRRFSAQSFSTTSSAAATSSAATLTAPVSSINYFTNPMITANNFFSQSVSSINSISTSITTTLAPSNILSPISKSINIVTEIFSAGLLFLKRTFQPSILRRKRKHGFLARKADKDGRHVLNRRKEKGRTLLCP